MKKMMQFIAMALVLVMTMMTVPAFAESDRVEVKFAVGDSVLFINGTPVEVETPYVVGAGVTLVPLRVITEAFGAKVEWISTTQTINLSYPDVEIVLQIGNPVAEVNGKAEMLLSSPELTQNGFTMVPLRFISENFGATVSYDEVTRGITVVKEDAQGGEIVAGATNEKNIGDSYYGWSMENPIGAQMDEREFDGTYTLFTYDDKNGFDISIYINEEDYDFERDYVEFKNSLSGYTLVKADKDTSNPKKKVMHFQIKDTEKFGDIWIYVTDKYYFILWGTFELANVRMLENGQRILETFDCSFAEAETYDLSNVKNGMRRYTMDNLKFSLDIPDDLSIVSSEYLSNEVEFMKMDMNDNETRISVAVYSKSDVGSAEEMAEKDYNGNKNILNEKVCKFEELVQKEYKNFSAWEYVLNVDAVSAKYVGRDVFFELGDYVYNVNVNLKMPNGSAQSIMDTIFNSIEAEELNSQEVGVLMRNLPDEDGTYSVSEKDWKITVPNLYYEVDKNEAGVVLQNVRSAAICGFVNEKADGATAGDVRRILQEIEAEAKKESNVKIIQPTKQITFGNTGYSEMICSVDENGILTYVHQLATVKSGKIVLFTFRFVELSYTERAISEAYDIVKSLEITR